MHLGVITDGISRDLAHALRVMDDYGLTHAELQFIGDKEVGDLTRQEEAAALALIRAHDKRVPCISRHLFARLKVGEVRPGDATHSAHMDALKRCIDMADRFDCPLVRIMTGKKEMILWGYHGAEVWNVAKGAWDAHLELIAPAVEFARAAGKTLAVETGNGTMVNSAFTARRLIDDLGAKDTLGVLWDPANNCWCGERGFPDGYEELRGGYIRHIHIKDVHADAPRATLEVRPMETGDLAGQFQPMAEALRADGYGGAISFESVYHNGDGDFEAGFHLNIGRFKAIFGDPEDTGATAQGR